MELLARTCKTERMNAQRLFARIFLIIGGLFWVFMAWGAARAYRGAPFTEALSGALVYVAIIAVVFLIGLFYENLAGLLLIVAATGLVVFGVVSGWESGVWATVFFFLMVPMLLTGLLYVLAARMQKICELEE